MHFLIFGVLATYSFGAYVVGDTLGHWFIVDLWPNCYLTHDLMHFLSLRIFGFWFFVKF